MRNKDLDQDEWVYTFEGKMCPTGETSRPTVVVNPNLGGSKFGLPVFFLDTRSYGFF